MKVKEGLHRFLALLLAVAVFSTSFSVETFAEAASGMEVSDEDNGENVQEESLEAVAEETEYVSEADLEAAKEGNEEDGEVSGNAGNDGESKTASDNEEPVYESGDVKTESPKDGEDEAANGNEDETAQEEEIPEDQETGADTEAPAAGENESEEAPEPEESESEEVPAAGENESEEAPAPEESESEEAPAAGENESEEGNSEEAPTEEKSESEEDPEPEESNSEGDPKPEEAEAGEDPKPEESESEEAPAEEETETAEGLKEETETVEDPETEEEETEVSLWTLSGKIFEDLDGDGKQGEDEVGFVDVEVCAYPEGEDEPAASDVTDWDGVYELKDLEEGTYRIEIRAEENYFALYDLEASKERLEEEVEVASGTEDWSLRYVNVELTEDKELVLPMLVNEELIRSSYDFDAEPLAASNESATIAGFRPYYDGEPIVKIVKNPSKYNLKSAFANYTAFTGYYDTRYNPQSSSPKVPYLYCLELNVNAIPDGKTTSGRVIYSGGILSSVVKNETKRERLQRIAYYSAYWPGWGSLTQDQRMCYYMAAQALIWQLTTGGSISDGKVSGGAVFQFYKETSKTKINLSGYKNRILEKVLNHNAKGTKPSFAGTTQTLTKVNGEDNKIYTITDTNGVLRGWEVESFGDGIKSVTIDGNQLKIVMKPASKYNNASYTISLKHATLRYCLDPNCNTSAHQGKNRHYSSSTNQDLFERGTVGGTVNLDIYWKAEGTVRIRKTDDNGNGVAGVVFKYGTDPNNLNLTTSATDASGYTTIKVNAPATVYVQEYTVPAGLQKDTAVKSQNVTAGNSYDMTFVNKRYRSVKLKKTDSSENPVAGAQFEYYAEGSSQKYRGTTNANGEFTSSGVFTAGTTIVMTELSTDNEHMLPADTASRTKRLTLTTNDNANVFSFSNDLFKVNLKLVKKNSRTEQPIEGMVFRIGTDSKLSDPSKYKEYTTDGDGVVTSEWFTYKSGMAYLYYQEVDGPDNIEIDSAIKRVAISGSGGTATAWRTYQETVFDNETPLTVKIKKTGSDGKALDGITFALQRYESGRWRTVQTRKTANGGTAAFSARISREDIAKGYIGLLETSMGSVKGYQKRSDRYVLPAELADSKSEEIEIEFENAKIDTLLKIYKYDEDTKKPLAGAVFEITDVSGNRVLTLTTGAGGTATTDELYADTVYYIEETSPPKGYKLNTAAKGKKRFVLEKTGNSQIDGTPYSYYYEVPNTPVYGQIKIKKVDDRNRPLNGIEFTIYKNNVAVEMLRTNENGEATSRRLLADAPYTVRETYCPPQYWELTFPAQTIDFLNPPSSSGNSWRNGEWLGAASGSADKGLIEVTYTVTNTKKLGSVTIWKVDSENKDIKVKNAVFRLSNYYTGELIGTAVTDADGYACFEDLPLVNELVDPTQGSYVLEEIASGDDHVLSEKAADRKWYFTLTAKKAHKDISFEIPNQPVKGNVQILKVDRDDPAQVLEGAGFAVYEEEEYKEADAGNRTPVPVQTGETGEDGIVRFEGLRYGTYIIKETKAAKYHYNDLVNGGNEKYWDASVQGYRVTVSKQDEEIPITVTNPKLYIKVQVHKEGYGHAPLANVKFRICRADGTALGDTIRTGEDGIAVSDAIYAEELGEGAYVVEVGKVPGYYQNTTKYPIDVTSGTDTEVEVKSVTVTNEREPASLKLHKVNEDGDGVEARFRVEVEQIYEDTVQWGTTFYFDTKKENGYVADMASLLAYIDDFWGAYQSYIPFTIRVYEESTEESYRLLSGSIAEFVYYPWYEEKSRRLWKGSLADEVTWDNNTAVLTVVNKRIRISLNLIKKGSGGYLSGAEFSIQPNGIDADPITVFSNGTAEGVEVELPYAESYTITEVNAPDGYISEGGARTISLSAFENQTASAAGQIVEYNHSVSFDNYRAPDVYLKKVGSDGKVLNARFRVEQVSPEAYAGRSTTVETAASGDGLGKVDLGPFYYELDQYSMYLRITEEWVDPGYVLDRSMYVVLSMSASRGSQFWYIGEKSDNVTVEEGTNSDGSKRFTITVTDEKKDDHFYIRKRGTGNDSVSANVSIDCYVNVNGNAGPRVFLNKYDISSEERVSLDDLFNAIDRAPYDAEDGYNIYMTENSASEGYKKAPDLKAFTYYPEKNGLEKFQNINEKYISIETDSGSSNTFTVNFINEAVTARLYLKKVDADTGEPLAGAKIEVTTGSGVTKTLITTGAADGDPLDLPYAESYTITEVCAPEGYELLEEAATLGIDSFTEKTENGETFYQGEVTLKNVKAFELYFYKTDEYGEPAEASFTVTAYPRSSTAYTYQVETVNGRVDLKPVVKKLLTIANSDSTLWYLYLTETGTQSGLNAYSGNIMEIVLSPQWIATKDSQYLSMTALIPGAVTDITYDTDGSCASAHFTLKNQNIPVYLKILKQDSSTRAYLDGAVFEVTPEGKEPYTLTTDRSPDAEWLRIPYADSYTVIEKDAPDGYVADRTPRIYSIDDFTRSEDENGISYSLAVTIPNEPIRGRIRLFKYDADDADNEGKKALMAGAQFGIYKGSAPAAETPEEMYAAVSEENGYELADTVTIGEDGTGISGELPYGTYVIKELKAPVNYRLSYTVEEKQIARDEETVPIYWPNERKEGSLQVYKYDRDTKTPLANVGFRVYDAETNEAFGEEVFTGVDGCLTVTLPYGSYYIKETSPLTGYVQVSGEWEAAFEIGSENEEKRLEVPNEKGYKFRLVKQNEEGEYLAGAVFGLFADGTSPYDEEAPAKELIRFETNSAGIAYVTLAEPGDYDIYELAPPDGYELLTDKFEVSVENQGLVAEVGPIIDQRLPIEVEIMKVDRDDQTKYLAGAVFEIYNQDTGKLVATTAKTGSDGKVKVEVPAGDITYSVVEKQAPEGYVRNDEALKLTLRKETGEGGKVTFYAEPLTVTNEKQKDGTIRLIKTEEGKPDKPLPGAVYGIYDSNGSLVKTLTTDVNGEAEMTGLPYGTYEVREITPPEGYDFDKLSLHTVTLTEEVPIFTVKAEDPALLSGFRVKKVDAKDANRTLPGAVFKVFSDWNQAYDYDAERTDEENGVVQTRMTGDDGIAVFEKLPYGTYYVLESEAPEGYSVSMDISEVTVNASSETEMVVIFEDFEAKDSFRVVKKDADTGTYLAGATFEVKEDSEDENAYVKEYVTDENGAFKTEELLYGTYIVTEVKAPEGYRLCDPVSQTVVLNEDSWKDPVTVEFEDELIESSIRIVKTDGREEAPSCLPGARFSLYEADGNGEPVGEVLQTLVTGLDGTAETIRLPVGNYVLVEESAPMGYKILKPGSDRFTVSISEDSEEVVEKIVPNEPITGRLSIRKLDKDTKEGLNDVVFTVYRQTAADSGTSGETSESGYVRYAELTTQTVDGEDGIAVLEDIPYGIYYVEETGVPEGYVNAGYQAFFRINESEEDTEGSEDSETQEILEGQEIVLTVENTPIKGRIRLIKVDAADQSAGVAGARYGIYAALKEDGTDVDTNAYLGEEYDLVTLPDVLQEDEETGEMLPVHQAAVSGYLPYGTYYVKEISPPENYEQNDTVYTAPILEEEAEIEITAEDTKLEGTVKIHKVDEQGKDLKDAIFVIYTESEYQTLQADDADGTGIFLTTDENGCAEYTGLRLGEKYVMLEYRAPAGYEETGDFEEWFVPTAQQLSFEYTCVNVKLDEITIRKVDMRGNLVTTAIFGLYGFGPDGIARTSDDVYIDQFGNGGAYGGIAHYTTRDLRNGWYYVKELKEPEGGFRRSDEIIEFELTDTQRSYEFTFVNEPYEARLKLNKTDENGEPLTGAVFELYKIDGSQAEEEDGADSCELVRTIDLSESPEALITGLEATEAYILKEVKAPEGYKRAEEDLYILFYNMGGLVTEDKESFYYLDVEVANEPDTGRIRIQKEVSNDTGISANYSLKDAKFRIEDSEGEEIAELTTDEKGTAVSDELPYGTYTITEIKAPDGTVLNGSKGTVTIDGSQPEGIYEYTHTNTVRTGQIIIYKKDDDQQSLRGAEFEIVSMKDHTVADVATTDDTGTAESKDLPAGTYLVRETKTPEDHTFGDFMQKICEIGADEAAVIELTFYNTFDTGWGLKAFKYDEDDPEKGLVGAEFSLYRAEDAAMEEPILEGLVTDENGYLILDESYGLEAGVEYMLVETKEPEGYVLDSTPHYFTVRDGAWVPLYISNGSPSGRITFVKTGDVLADATRDEMLPDLTKLIWKEQSLSGAEIGIYAANEVTWNGKTYAAGDLMQTLKSGETSAYLPVGTYEYQELSAPLAYKLDTERHQIRVTEETEENTAPAEAVIRNEMADVEIRLHKLLKDLDASVDPADAYGNVVFGIYTAEDILAGDTRVSENTLLGLFRIGEDGTGTWKEQRLPEGNYYVRELATADGYVLDEEEHPFAVAYDNEDVRIEIGSEEEPIVNEPLYGLIRVLKYGPVLSGVNTVPGPVKDCYVSLPIWGEGELDGAVFEIRATEAVVIDGISYAEGDVVDTLITGENSTSIALPLGRWELTEIKAPDGYEIDPDSQSEIVELTAAEGSNEVTVQEVRRVNKKADIALTVYKRFFGLDEAEAAGLYKNVYFGIYADQDISATDGKVIISKHMLLDVIEIGEDGRGTKDDLYLPAGSYYVKELATADGYMVDETKYSFTVRAADTDEIAIEGIDEDNPVVNYTEGSIPFAFRKTDENKDPLEGAEFTLYRCTDDTAGHEHSELAGEENSCWTEISGIAPKISGADGIVDFNRLPAGDYQLAETKAPDGYKRPTGQWYIHVAPEADTPITIEARGNELPPAFMKTEDTDICQYQVKNYEDGGMPWSGGRGVFPYLGGGSSLLAAAALLFKRRREEEPDEKKKTAE